MINSKKLILSILAAALFGCSTSGSKYFDSAMNDRNRAPASIGIPESYVGDAPIIDNVHNQAEADFLFLKSDLESLAGRSSESIELLKAALIYDPQAATIMQKLAIEFYKRGQTRDALYWAERAKATAPEDRDIQLLVGGLYTTTKNYAKAEAVYSALLKKDKMDSEAILYMGAVYTEMKDYKKALNCFSKLKTHAQYASKHMAYYYSARVMLEQNRKDSMALAEVELKKAIDLKHDFFEGISLLGQLIQKNKGSTQAFRFYIDTQKKYGPIPKLAEILSQYYIEKNDYDKAYEQLEILDSNADELYQVKLKMALILIEKKQFDPAIAKLEEILASAPESDKVRFYLSAVFEEKKEFKNAYQQYMQIAKDSSYFEEARLHAAYLAKLMGEPDKAINVLEASIQNKVENPQTYFLMTQFHEENKDFKKSLDVLKLAEEKFPENPQVFFYKGSIQDKMNLKQDMILSMKKVLELDQDHVQAMNYLAFSWAELGQELEQAEKLARKAVSKEKEDAFILDTLGWVLYKKGQYKEAKGILEKAYEMQPSVGIIAEHLGDVYTKMNKLEKAKILFIKASEDETDDSRKKDILQKISQLESSIQQALRKPASASSDSELSESP